MTLIEKALARKNALKQTKKSSQTTPINEDTNTQSSVSNVDIVGQEQAKDIAEFNATTDKTEHLTIDLESLAKRGYLVETGKRLCITEEFRQIKRKLIANAFGSGAKTLNNGNLIMVTSAKPNEGKTFIATNLALSIAAEKNKTVLLVDSDVLMPSLNHELGLAETKGLIDYLHSDDLDVSKIIYNTNIEKLKIISAGKTHHLSNELLASEKMAILANELATRYPDRIVIFDSPPLIGISETLVLAQHMGQALLVVEESKTRIADIQKATENLHEDLALGLVLNKAIRSHKDLYGYYGYGYGDN